MPKCSANEKDRLKNLLDRLDFLKRWFLELDRDRVTAELVKDALDLVTRTRKAIAAKRFEAALLYHELEDLHRFLAEQFEMPEELSRAQRDAQYIEGRWNAAHAPRQKLIDRRERCLNEIAALKSNSASNLTDDVINRQMAAKYGVTTHTIRNYRRSKGGN